MNTFLSKISKLDAVQDVILLSTQGGPLFFSKKNKSTENENKLFTDWNEIISALDHPQTAEFIFNRGSYCLTRTDIGYIIIGVTDDNTLKQVKQSCIAILTKLSDPTLCKRVLLNLLSKSSDIFKPHIIKELSPYADNKVAAVLAFLLERNNEFTSELREELLLLICQTLGYCASSEAIDALENFLSGANNLNCNITEAARISLEQLNNHKPSKKNKPSSMSPLKKQQETTLNIPENQQVDELLAQGKTSEAVALISRLIEQFSKKRQFTTAYKLRDWLIEINPMALTEIIHSAEVIEKEKQDSISKAHLRIWKGLVDILSTEEFSSLYHSMTLKTYSKGKIIVRQGTKSRTLLFLNSGRLRPQVLKQDLPTPLKTKGAGEILGAGTFFEASVWTTTVESLGCEVFLLPRAKFEALAEFHPSLESKLLNFCSGFQSTSAQLKKSGRNRRIFNRRKVSGRIAFAVLNKDGKEVSSEVKGNLVDISKGGVSFSIHSSQKKNAATLFARQLRISITTEAASNTLIYTGTVQAVRDMDLIGNEYSLHLKFRKQLSNSDLHRIINSHS